MIIFNSFFFAINGLFDFDLTFFLQAFLFFLFSISITNFFLIPISETLKKRSYIINFTNHKSAIYLTLLFEKIVFSLNYYKNQKMEMSRELLNFDIFLQSKFFFEKKNIEEKIFLFLKNFEIFFFYKSIFTIFYISNSIEKILEKKIDF